MSTVLTAKARNEFGKERAKKLRGAGLVPGVLYGSGQESEPVLLNYHDLDVMAKRVHGQTVMIDLNVEDAKGGQRTEKVFLRELQRDPVSEKIIHVDLYRVDLQKPIVVEVPIVGVGIPAGVKIGGLLETLTRTISLRCLPQDVPPHLDVDISEINVGHSIHVSEVPWPESLDILTDGETALFTVLGKRAAEEEEVAAEAAAAETEGPEEPEVIGRKKKEEEESEEEEK